MKDLVNTQSNPHTPPANAEHQEVCVVVDAMGGDGAPQVVVDGARQVLESTRAEDLGIKFIMVGNVDASSLLKEQFPHRVELVASTEVIEMNEHPALAVKQKKDSSIVVGCRLVKEGRGDAFFSAGSTGGAMTAATLIIGRVRGVKRPAIATVIPAPKGNVVLIDAGANADVEAEYLLQFAAMGEIYARDVLGVKNPRVGLLNVGEEDTKGSQLAQDAYVLLKDNINGFAGNAEGNDLFAGTFDVITTDGFTGNIVLKTMEGLVSGLFKELKDIFYASTINKLAAAVIKKDLTALKNHMDIDAIGGAPLLGLQAPVGIGHGSSNAVAIANGIRATATATRRRVPELIAKAVTS
ncbi:MAG: phosphate acyltransferase PlsX [Coriobacteriia bacterium]|nr:phosphate acyltransferase PlsX [Coriobacteriia bacterium]